MLEFFYALLGKSRREEGDRLFEQGGRAYQAFQFPQALQAWQQALAIYQAIDDREGLAMVLGNIGNLYQITGDYDRAMEYHQRRLVSGRDGARAERVVRSVS